MVKARIITEDAHWEPSLASWFLAMKSEEGKKATFSHWPKFDALFATPIVDYAVALARGQS